jgi:hypothetical protein
MMVKRSFIWRVVLLGIFLLTLALLRAGAGEKPEGAGGPPYPNDAGPSQIDVSSYPKEIQSEYPMFARRCAQCHTLARAINSQYLQLTPEEQKTARAQDPDIFLDNKIWHISDSAWSGYVERMHAKPGSILRIRPAEFDQIIEFLVYDSKVRKMGANHTAWHVQRQKLLDDFKLHHPEDYKDLIGEK